MIEFLPLGALCQTVFTYNDRRFKLELLRE